MIWLPKESFEHKFHGNGCAEHILWRKNPIFATCERENTITLNKSQSFSTFLFANGSKYQELVLEKGEFIVFWIKYSEGCVKYKKQ